MLNASYLFVPGDQPQKIRKAILSKADVVIVDLEDAVTNSNKEVARNIIIEEFKNFQVTRNTVLRINSLSSEYWKQDLSVVLSTNIETIMLPKVEEAFEIDMVNKYLYELGLKKWSLIPLIESAKGVLNLNSILQNTKNIERVAFGSLDYIENIKGKLTDDEEALLFAKSLIVNASIAANINSPIDCPYFEIDNDEGFKNIVIKNLKLGFHSKLLVHPRQIQLLHDVITPTFEELKEAYEIVSIYEENVKFSTGALLYKGKMIDFPAYQIAKNTIEKAKNIEGELT